MEQCQTLFIQKAISGSLLGFCSAAVLLTIAQVPLNKLPSHPGIPWGGLIGTFISVVIQKNLGDEDEINEGGK